jgi:carbon-monoxide dehydrogenase large subunit
MALYVDDVRLPDMLHLAFVRSPHARARIRHIDPSAALRRPGVPVVLDGPGLARDTQPYRQMAGLRPITFYGLALDSVRYVGEPVAAVLASDPYLAWDAAGDVVVHYEPLPPVGTTADALAPDAPRLFADWPDNVLMHRQFRAGSPNEVLEGAAVRLEESFATQRHTAHPIEPRGVVAAFRDGALDVWLPTQEPYILRELLSEVLGLPQDAIRMNGLAIGGSFGVKIHLYGEIVVACTLARRFGRPIKWVETRSEHFVGTAHAREQTWRVRAGATHEGTIVALAAEIVADVGAGLIFMPGVGPATNAALMFPGPYRVQHYSYDLRCVVTNKTPAGAYRGFGVVVAAYVMERVVDLLAERLGLDPLELRRRNMLAPEDLPYVTATGAQLDTGSYVRSLEHAAALADYQTLRRAQAEGRRHGERLGIGVAVTVEPSAADLKISTGSWGCYDATKIRLHTSGLAEVMPGIAPQGKGYRETFAQLVAEELEMDPEDIDVVFGSAEVVPYALGTFSSRATTVGAASIHLACFQLRRELRERLASVFRLSADEVRVSEHPLRFRPLTGGDLTLAQALRLLEEGGLKQVEALGIFDPPGLGRHPDGRLNKYAAYGNAAHIVTCRIDPETGAVQLLTYTAVHDSGRIVNHTYADGQIVGGIVQGIAGALSEELVYGPDGQLLTGSFLDYALPRATDIPPIHVHHIETPSRWPGGIKGLGEAGTTAAPAAVANAVADALHPISALVRRTPLDPKRVWALLQTLAKPQTSKEAS